MSALALVKRRSLPLRLLSLFLLVLAVGFLLFPWAGEPRPPSTARLVAAGDIILHTPILTAAWDPVSSRYDFRPIFHHVRPFFAEADLALAVLETTLGAAEGGYTGYPRFHSPAAIAEALRWAGVDLVFTAHNHALDRGVEGVFRTIDHLDRAGLLHVGTARTPDPGARVVLREINGMRFAFLAYTTSTNGLPLPAGREWAVNLYRREQAAADVALARRLGAEVIVCALHAGVEYKREPSPEQRAIVEELFTFGVDVVLGSHPHVIQPIVVKSRPGPEGISRPVLAAYSLGNFLSNQRWRYSDCGLLLDLEWEKPADGRPRLKQARWQLAWVHKYYASGRPVFRILPVDKQTLSVYAVDPLLGEADRARLHQAWEDTRTLVGPEEVALE
ncbi:MAG: CapA family protein [Bacillota bacterium]